MAANTANDAKATTKSTGSKVGTGRTQPKAYVAPAHFCAACRAEGKTWEGDDPKCAFQHGQPFSPDNWNCATVARVRALLRFEHDDHGPDGLKKDWSAEGYQSYATLRLDDWFEFGDVPIHALYITWYKNRGRTGGMWLIGDEDSGPPRAPVEAEVVLILKHYSPEETAMRARHKIGWNDRPGLAVREVDHF
jgi:hypothetical protein